MKGAEFQKIPNLSSEAFKSQALLFEFIIIFQKQLKIK